MVTEPCRAVFLSYASQDSVVVNRICDALRDAGVSVWFDQNELRGGEVWDRQIRDRIHACRLFIAVVSANTESRGEGYFRREWNLAVDRTNDLAEDVSFLLPVLITRTDPATARVPRKFRDVHWARLKDGEVPSDFIVRVMQLLGLNIATTVQQGGASSELHPDTPSLPLRKRLLKRWWAPLIAGPILVVGAIAYVWLADRRTVSVPAAAGHGGRAEVTSSSMPERSLAVLPFVDMSEKRDQEYFADGMSEEILDLLARIPGLTVIGRTSSFQFKGKNGDLKTIGSSLGAAVVEGSVRKSGSRIRVTAQLIDTRSGAHVWSESYDRDFGDTLLLQDQIATSVHIRPQRSRLVSLLL